MDTKNFYKFINLHIGEEDKNKVSENIRANISFKNANLWILACAIVVASVGLNVNSTAVIIGAMLISPLMGPIIGSGFALGIYDFRLFKKSVKNLGIATLVSLAVSAIYFWLSPLKEAQSELLARTSPNIYDVLIAFFGGLVGVIAITRVEKGNPIPGVAIATALMPPLCTAGYGIAIGNYKFFLGAFYLYSINCVFIGIATFIIIKYLKYPHVKWVNETDRKKIQYGITFITLLILIPSIYFAFVLFKEQNFKRITDEFIQKEFIEQGLTVVYKNTNFNNINNTVELAFLNKEHSDEEIATLNEKLKNYNLNHTKLIIKKNSKEISEKEINEINELQVKEKRIKELEKTIQNTIVENQNLLKEIQILNPKITKTSLSKQNIYSGDGNNYEEVLFLLYTANSVLTKEEVNMLKQWLSVRFSENNVQLVQFDQNEKK